jgi:hypothetical protein
MINQGFLKHGMFIEGRPTTTLLRYQNCKAQPTLLNRLIMMLPEAVRAAPDPTPLIKSFIQAMNDMSVKSVWLPLFNANEELDPDSKGATSALKSAGINEATGPTLWMITIFANSIVA